MNIYVGNLPYDISEEELREAFSECGEVTRVTIVKDKLNGKSRGFGFVEMPDEEQGRVAIMNINGKEVRGRPLRVTEAHPRPDIKAPHRRRERHGVY